MKKILSMLLALMFCFGALISCGNEENSSSSSESVFQTESASEEHKSEVTTETETETNLGEGVVLGITRDTFANAYESWIGWYYEAGISEDNYHQFSCVKAIFTYEEFQKGAIDSRPTGITEQTFEDNFVVIIRGFEGHIRSYDIHYTDFKKEEDHYMLIYNSVYCWGDMFSEAIQPFCDVCIIPKELSDDANPQIIKVIEKQYIFSGEKYNSPCEVYTEIHDVIGD